MLMRLRSVLAAVCLAAATAGAQDTSTAAAHDTATAATQNTTTAQTAAPATTAAVFLPGYGVGDWRALRGSIVASDENVTTYTLFCVEQTPLSCVLDANIPLRFAEGPSTLKFHGTDPGEITAHLNCHLAGTTAATCTGSSSYGTGIREGTVTGPTETVWTSTLTGSEVRWGVLTLTTPPAATATTNLDATALDATGLDGPTPASSASASAQTSAPSTPSSGGSSIVRSCSMGCSLIAASACALASLL